MMVHPDVVILHVPLRVSRLSQMPVTDCVTPAASWTQASKKSMGGYVCVLLM